MLTLRYLQSRPALTAFAATRALRAKRTLSDPLVRDLRWRVSPLRHRFRGPRAALTRTKLRHGTGRRRQSTIGTALIVLYNLRLGSVLRASASASARNTATAREAGISRRTSCSRDRHPQPGRASRFRPRARASRRPLPIRANLLDFAGGSGEKSRSASSEPGAALGELASPPTFAPTKRKISTDGLG